MQSLTGELSHNPRENGEQSSVNAFFTNNFRRIFLQFEEKLFSGGEEAAESGKDSIISKLFNRRFQS